MPPAVQLAISIRVIEDTHLETGAYLGTTSIEVRLDGAHSVATIDAALAAIEKLKQPGKHRAVVDHLAEVKAVARARNEATEDVAMTFAMLAKLLAQYPGPIVHGALSAWSDTSPWFPAWAARIRRRPRR